MRTSRTPRQTRALLVLAVPAAAVGMGFNYGVGRSSGDFGFTSFEVDSQDE